MNPSRSVPSGRWFARLRAFVAGLALGGLASAVPGQVALPEIGDPSRGTLSSVDERALGEAFLREVRAYLPLIEDSEVVGYVRGLGDRLSAASEDAQQGFRFFVVGAPEVNAFAGPGGIIAVNTGLILLSNTESELAAVIAHEMAHVTQRHIARAVESASRSSLPAIAGVIAALVLATQSAEAGQAALATVMAGTVQNRLDFSRQNEQEADRVGTALLERAGFDPRAMPTFFERLQLSQRYVSEPPEFLSTHPVSSSRIADSRARAEQFPYRQHRDADSYYLVKAKVRALGEPDPAKAVNDFTSALESGQYRLEAGARYGLAVALMRSRRWSDAKRQIEKLREADPDRVSFRAAAAEIDFQLGEVERALAGYRDTLSIFPNDEMTTHRYADTLVRLRKHEAAVTLLENYLKARPPLAGTYQLLATAYDGLGRTLAANVAIAERQYLLGDLGAAIHQLGIGLRGREDSDYTTARAQARLEELQAERALRAER